MTDTIVHVEPATEPASEPEARPRRPVRARPNGVPGWLWLLGVTIHPVDGPRADGSRAWVVSAGIGPASLAALFFDRTEQEPDLTTRSPATERNPR